MIRLLGLLLLATSTALANAEGMKDPESWYRNDYAVLWADNPAKNIDKLRTFYADVILTHESSGEVSSEPQQAWLVEPMQAWVAEGWQKAVLVDLQVHPINASTVAFTARWTDYYDGGATEASCGWYLADAMSGEWVFTEYADTVCPE